MRKSMLDALFPKIRQGILKACLMHPEKWWYLSDLARNLKSSPSSLQRELASLAESGLLRFRRDGNRVYYQVNLACPGALELQSLLIKTAGVTDLVRGMLKKFESKIDLAFIFGSTARGSLTPESDIDLLIVGTLKLVDLAPAIAKTELELAREINPVMFSRNEFSEKARANNAFLMTVFNDQKIFVKGADDELTAMVGSRRSSTGRSHRRIAK
jgi:predicted nucleotidyltransferase